MAISDGEMVSLNLNFLGSKSRKCTSAAIWERLDTRITNHSRRMPTTSPLPLVHNKSQFKPTILPWISSVF